MKKIKRAANRIALASACIALALSFTGCSEDININVNSMQASVDESAVTAPAADVTGVFDSSVTEIPETSAVTEVSAVTSADSVSGVSSSVNVSSSTAVSGKTSYLIINKPAFNHYSVINGYYKMNFLSDKEFQNQINDDIKKAMDKIALSYDPGYLAEKDAELYKNKWYNIINGYYDTDELEQTNGIAIEVICENGYLSVALGYLDSDGFTCEETGRYGYSNTERYWDVVETLNYDIINNKKIEKFSELFREGTDITAALNNAVEYYNNDRIHSVVSEPEHFTIYYTLQDNNGEYYNDYTTLQYFDRDAGAGYENLGILKAAEYRDMSDKIKSSIAANQLFDEKIHDEFEVVEEDGVRYSRIKASVLRNADEIRALNEKIKTIQHNAVERFGCKDCYKTDFETSHPLADSVQASADDYFNNIIYIYELNKEQTLYYDAETCEPVTVEGFVNGNWKDYAQSEDCSEKVAGAPVHIWRIDRDNNTVEFGCEYSYAGESVYFTVPADKINSKYSLR